MKKLAILIVSVLVCSTTQAATTYGNDIYYLYDDTFGHYHSSSGRLRKFPIMSQIEQGFPHTHGAYNYQTNYRRGKAKGYSHSDPSNLSLACGPISLLMLKSNKYRIYDKYKNNKTLKQDVLNLRKKVGIYSNINTNVYQLDKMAKNLRFRSSTIRYGYSPYVGNDKYRMMNDVISDLKAGRKAVILLKSNASFNPSGGRHFMTIYKIVDYNRTIYKNGKWVKHAYVYMLNPWSGTRVIRSLYDVANALELGDYQDYLSVKI